jgi:hypothetical protein
LEAGKSKIKVSISDEGLAELHPHMAKEQRKANPLLKAFLIALIHSVLPVEPPSGFHLPTLAMGMKFPTQEFGEMHL